MSEPRAALAGRLRAVLTTDLQAAGFDLEDVVITSAGRRRQVSVIVDRDGGLTLDDVAEASTMVSQLLDDTGVLGEAPYVLEVGSPGVDRPLREPRHWRRAVGRLVDVRVDGQRTGNARILAADEAGVVLLPAGTPPGAGERRVPYAALGPGAVQVEFGRPEIEEAEFPQPHPAGRT